jgi:hypothetical protein
MLTAKHLLYKVLDYTCIWNAPSHRDSEPAKARKAQLDILLKAFDIDIKNAKYETKTPHLEPEPNTISQEVYYMTGLNKSLNRLEYIKKRGNIEYLTSGQFMVDRDIEKYNNNLEFLLSNIKPVFSKELENRDPYSIRLPDIFSVLYMHRSVAYFSFESSFMRSQKSSEFRIEDAYTSHIKQETMPKITHALLDIDDILCTLIDPEKRTFTKEEIQYPEYDFL